MHTTLREYATEVIKELLSGIRWIIFGIICGIIIGAIGALFALSIGTVTALRQAHPWILFALPVAGIIIIFCYHLIGSREDKGTNTVITAIREEQTVPPQMAPLIFLSTVLTHLCGGSAGREGAALQLGGSLGNILGSIFHLNKQDRKRMIMCGMSAAFSALFGTPLAAAIFSLELSTVGFMYYSALVPCVVSALTAHAVAGFLGASESELILQSIPAFGIKTAVLAGIIAILCALVSVVFCVSMHRCEDLMESKIHNEYLRIILAAAVIILMTLLVGDQTYNGAGSQIIAACISTEGQAVPAYSFLLKILFTAVTLAGGFKGGEIVPSLFIGATLGSTLGNIFGMSAPLCASIGMGALFCGVTNCPIASMLICFEMFGFEPMPYYMIAIALSYMFSGNFGLYHSQIIRFDKFEHVEQNAKVHR